MKLTTRLVMAMGTVFGLAAAAMAVPAVLEQVPDNAAIVVTIPNPTAMEKNIQALATATEAPLPPFGVKDLLAMGGFMDGVASDKAIAVVFTAPADKNAEFEPDNKDALSFLLPITSYEGLLKNFDAKATGGTDKLTTPDGKELFVRDLKNGYAVLSESQIAVDSFKVGKKDAITGPAGKAGTDLIDSSDLVMIVNVDVLRPFMSKAIEKAKAEAKERLANLPGVEVSDDGMDSPLAQWMQERLTNDTRMLVQGVKCSSMGARFDLSASFVKDSTLAKTFSSDAAAGALLKHLPQQPYLLAFALDTSAAPLKAFMKEFGEKAKASKPKDAAAMPDFMDMSFSDADGYATVVGFNPGMLMGGGVLTSTVSFTKTTNPDKVINDNIRKAVESLNGYDNEQVSIASKYTVGTSTVGTAKTPMDTWEIKFTPKEDSMEGQQAIQAMTMIFGPSAAPSGFVAKSSSGVYQTYAKNTPLMAAALDAAGGDKNLGKDTMISQVGDQLPKNRVAEAYIGAKSIIDTAVPMMGMMGVQIDPARIPKEIPAIGFAISNSDGAARFTAFVPAPVIKTGAMIAIEMQRAKTEAEQMGGEEDTSDNDGDKSGTGSGGTGQPKF